MTMIEVASLDSDETQNKDKMITVIKKNKINTASTVPVTLSHNSLWIKIYVTNIYECENTSLSLSIIIFSFPQ